MKTPDYNALTEEARSSFDNAGDERALEEARVEWIGRKGRITILLRDIPELAAEDRPEAGRRLNAIKSELNLVLKARLNEFSTKSPVAGDAIDISHPGRTPFAGKLHPITKALREIIAVFREMGFDVAEGPEVETEYYNFEALNIPAHHPARGMWDTFYTQVLPAWCSGRIQVRYRFG